MEEAVSGELIPATEITTVLHGEGFEGVLTRLKDQAQLFFEGYVSDANAAELEAATLKISDNDSYKDAAEFRSVCRQKQREILEVTKPMKQRCDTVKAVVLNAEKNVTRGYGNAIGSLDPLLSAWEEKIRKAAEAEARKREAAERKRLEKEREAQAKEMLKHGNEEAAEEILSQPIVPPAHRPIVDIPKVAGQSTRKVYKGRVVNLMALVKAVAAGKAPISYLMANESAINAGVKAQGTMFSCPGIEIYSEDVRTSR